MGYLWALEMKWRDRFSLSDFTTRACLHPLCQIILLWLIHDYHTHSFSYIYLRAKMRVQKILLLTSLAIWSSACSSTEYWDLFWLLRRLPIWPTWFVVVFCSVVSIANRRRRHLSTNPQSLTTSDSCVCPHSPPPLTQRSCVHCVLFFNVQPQMFSLVISNCDKLAEVKLG